MRGRIFLRIIWCQPLSLSYSLGLEITEISVLDSLVTVSGISQEADDQRRPLAERGPQFFSFLLTSVS